MFPSKRRHAQEIALVYLTFVLIAGSFGSVIAADPNAQDLDRGKELFKREWLPGDKRSYAGDGLGPLFNERSCVACHHLGGAGGAGPMHTNVTVVSASLGSPSRSFSEWWFGVSRKPQQPARSKLAEIHPALARENSFPLHRFSTEKEFAKWQLKLLDLNEGTDVRDLERFLSEVDLIVIDNLSSSKDLGTATLVLRRSRRSAPPLFGLGVIDQIPERALLDAAAAQSRIARTSSAKADAALGRDPFTFAPIERLPLAGRVARLRDGRIGRFGWKGQTATLREFTLQACAIELGLEVPGFPQTAPPWKTGYKAPGLDMSADQCDALVRFVAALPTPSRLRPETQQHAAEIDMGQKLFSRIGCAACHRQKLGNVDGIYSDLLLHDMGSSLSDDGIYGSTVMAASGDVGPEPLPLVTDTTQNAERPKPPKFGAGPREWRTPPLWGLRDSAPYLHDGRANTISIAVSFHGGEAMDATREFSRLTLRERRQIEMFLLSLAAPAARQ